VRVILKNYFLHVNIIGFWKWQLEPFESYSLKGAYQMLSKDDQVVMLDQNEVIWNITLPLRDRYFKIS
jgi:hypothetical protein